jgi:hypothetical protein
MEVFVWDVLHLYFYKYYVYTVMNDISPHNHLRWLMDGGDEWMINKYIVYRFIGKLAYHIF